VTHLRSVDWEVRTIPEHGEVQRLVRAWHYAQGVPNTSTYRHGLYRAGVILHGDAHGATLWIPPTRSAAVALVGEDHCEGVLACSRLVVDPELPTNGASFLLGRSMRLIDRDRWPVFVTYADTAQGHTGAIYRATNWTCDGPVAAGDTWTNDHGQQRGRKRGGTTMTVDEMRAAGYTRSPALPKIRFYHDPLGLVPRHREMVA